MCEAGCHFSLSCTFEGNYKYIVHVRQRSTMGTRRIFSRGGQWGGLKDGSPPAGSRGSSPVGVLGRAIQSGRGHKNRWDPSEKVKETMVGRNYRKSKFWVWSGTEMEWCIVKVVMMMMMMMMMNRWEKDEMTVTGTHHRLVDEVRNWRHFLKMMHKYFVYWDIRQHLQQKKTLFNIFSPPPCPRLRAPMRITIVPHSVTLSGFASQCQPNS